MPCQRQVFSYQGRQRLVTENELAPASQMVSASFRRLIILIIQCGDRTSCIGAGTKADARERFELQHRVRAGETYYTAALPIGCSAKSLQR
jgi:hypothetical protein